MLYKEKDPNTWSYKTYDNYCFIIIIYTYLYSDAQFVQKSGSHLNNLAPEVYNEAHSILRTHKH
jgi:hypothetical protein